MSRFIFDCQKANVTLLIAKMCNCTIENAAFGHWEHNFVFKKINRVISPLLGAIALSFKLENLKD